MPAISAARLASLRNAAAAEATTSSKRDQILELVFAVGSGQFSKRLQRAIQAVAPKKDRPIAGLAFSTGRLLFGKKIKEAVKQVIHEPDSVEGVIELILAFPEQLVGTTNDELSPFMRNLVRLGVDKDALLLVQDVVLGSAQFTRLVADAVNAEDPSRLIPGVLGLVATMWPEIQADIDAIKT